MDALQLLTTRSSNGKLSDPAPDDETLALCLQAAVRAPDHGCIRPWRFRMVRGAAREALGRTLRDSLRLRSPDASEAELEKEARKPLRAPLIVVVAACTSDHPKVPEIEQVLSAAAAAQNVMLTLHARGFAGIWRTGAPAYDAEVKRALGFAERDHIVGFLYAGTPATAAPESRRPDPSELVEEWHGPR